jgi:flagellar basal body-associated protein FliL
MAEQPATAPEANAEKPSSMRFIILAGIVLVGAAVVGVLLYFFLLRPRLTAASETPKEKLPELANAVTLELPEERVTVLVDDPDAAAPILNYQVSMVCANQETKDLISARLDWFKSMVNKLHRNRTRKELNDPQVQEGLLKQARLEANKLLKKFSNDPKLEVLEVLYLKFAVFDI